MSFMFIKSLIKVPTDIADNQKHRTQSLTLGCFARLIL